MHSDLVNEYQESLSLVRNYDQYKNLVMDDGLRLMINDIYCISAVLTSLLEELRDNE